MRRETIYKKVSELPMPGSVQQSAAAVPPSNAVIEVGSKDHHETLIKSNKVLVLYLYSPSCGPCRALAPRYDKLADEWTPRGITFAKENALLRFTEGVKATPTINFYVNGKFYGDVIGGDVNKITEIINHIISTSA